MFVNKDLTTYITLDIFLFILGTLHFNDQLMRGVVMGHWKCHLLPYSWY